jgi:hypothetical protein
MSITHDGPTLLPEQRAQIGTSAGAGTSAPTLDHLEPATTGGSSASAPTASPPGTAGAQAGDQAGDQGVTGTWTTNVTVDAMWCIHETRNSWLHVTGGAWKKIYNARDGSYQALVTLAAQARQTGRTVSMREEADGMVYEIYLW